jgi:hypothetical protein
MLEHTGRSSLESVLQPLSFSIPVVLPLPLQITTAIYALRGLAIWNFSSRYQPSTSLPSATMACTRSRTHKSMTVSVVDSTPNSTWKQPGSLRLQRRSIIPQVGLPPDLYFHQVQLNSDTAKENILRLFFQEGSAPELPSSRYISAEDAIEYMSPVKLGVCLKLSASPPDSLQRIGALPHAIDSLDRCLRGVLKDENAITKDQEDIISRTRQQLDVILTSPDFVKCTSDTLFTNFLNVFAPNSSPKREEVPESLPIRSLSLTREQVGMHLEQSFADGYYNEEYMDSDWSRDAGLLLSECLNFDHENPFTYWIGRALRTSVNARAKAISGV